MATRHEEVHSLSPQSEERVYACWEELLSRIGSLSGQEAGQAINLSQFPDDLLVLAATAEPFLNVPTSEVPAAFTLLLAMVKNEQGEEWLPVVTAGLLSSMQSTSYRARLIACEVYEDCLRVLNEHGGLAALDGCSDMLNLMYDTPQQASRQLFHTHQLDEVQAQAALKRVYPRLLPQIHPYIEDDGRGKGLDYLAYLGDILGDGWNSIPTNRCNQDDFKRDVLDFIEGCAQYVPINATTAPSIAIAIAWLEEEGASLPRFSLPQVSSLFRELVQNDQELVRFGLSVATRQNLEALAVARPSPSPASRLRM